MLETLGSVRQWGRHQRLLRGCTDLITLVGRKSRSDMSHLVVKLSCALPCGGSLTMHGGSVDRCVDIGGDVRL